jgi:Rrf2 family protein
VNSQLPIAFHILGFLASQRGEPVTSDVMAHTYGTSPVVLRRVLAKLQRAGLVETRRGVHGGSVLARDPASINLRQIYDAVSNDPQVLHRYSDGCEGAVASALARFVDDVMGDAERALLDRLEAVTVAEMDNRVRADLRDAMSPTER